MTNLRSRRPRLSRRDLVLTRRSFKRALADAFFKLCGFLYYLFYPANNAIEVSRVAFASEKTPTAFDGCVLIQISDLHGKVFRNDSQRLFQLVEREKPDLILITGDLVDERNFDLQEAARVVARANAIAPVFYVSGNHESNLREPFYSQTIDAVREAGATILQDRVATLARRNGAIVAEPRQDETNYEERVDLIGVFDPVRSPMPDRDALRRALDSVTIRPERLTILASHRPEAFDLYVEKGCDLIFSGHAHGGQFRIPLLCPNGLNAPHQGWFPQYAGGVYEQCGSTMIVSRGLGPSVLPTRLFNRPELVVCRLTRRAKEDEKRDCG